MTRRERAILVGLELKGGASKRKPLFSAEESLEELAALAEAAGAVVVERVLQTRPGADRATLIGSGKVAELAAQVKAEDADLVLFDQELTPTQLRNLENELSAKILDRTQLILDIFARRARTREGQMQVELAQLNYLLPRLSGHGVEMSRLGGGIGTRGPGETKLETDRRRISQRISKIKHNLEGVRTGRSVQRKQRQAVPLATIALVGYTNAGKSTLFNRLTGAAVLADAKMFATLDPTVRQVILPSRRRVLLSDTVGFIRNLPTTLVKAFRATLEEVIEAALLLHVVDVSSPYAAQHAEHVLKVLAEIGAEETEQILVLNKVDMLPEVDARIGAETLMHRILGEKHARVAGISAKTGQGLKELQESIDAALQLDPVSLGRFRFPASEGGPLHLLHEYAHVTSTRYDGDCCEVEAETPLSVRERLKKWEVSS